jgi:hypothetical protein
VHGEKHWTDVFNGPEFLEVPMPPVSPQGSRGGLITAIVIFTIGFVTATIFAIYFGVANRRTEDDFAGYQSRVKKAISDPTAPAIVTAEDRAQNNNELRTKAASDQLLWEANQLSKAMVGADAVSTTRPSAALDAVADAHKDITSQLPDLQVPDDAVGTIRTLLTDDAAQRKRLKDLQDQQKIATASAVDTVGQVTEGQNAAQRTTEATNKKLQDALALVQSTKEDAQKQHEADRAAMDDTINTNNEKLKRYDLQHQNDVAMITTLTKEKENALIRLDGKRIQPEPIMTSKSDGKVVNRGTENVVYIDLGQNDQISEGMQFEVYPQRDGIPRLGDGMSDQDMPVGLGSLVVEKVFPSSSQCKVTHMEPGRHIQVGDVVGNLIYDRNVKFKFFVFGNFDLGQTGKPNDQDKTKLKSLIVQHGGALQDEINMDTDFIVMGLEPVVKQLPDENKDDPFMVKIQQDAEQARKDYDAVIAKARELHIPLMNQNRFLYYCGFYDWLQQ